MLQLTNAEQNKLKETLVQFGLAEDETIADELVRMTQKEEARQLYHNAEVFLKNIWKYKQVVEALKEEGEEESEDSYDHCAVLAVRKYERALSVLSKTKEFEVHVKILREYYEKRRTARSVYTELNMGKTCFFKVAKQAISLFRLVMFGAHTKNIELALELLNHGGDAKSY